MARYTGGSLPFTTDLLCILSDFQATVSCAANALTLRAAFRILIENLLIGARSLAQLAIWGTEVVSKLATLGYALTATHRFTSISGVPKVQVLLHTPPYTSIEILTERMVRAQLAAEVRRRFGPRIRAARAAVEAYPATAAWARRLAERPWPTGPGIRSESDAEGSQTARFTLL